MGPGFGTCIKKNNKKSPECILKECDQNEIYNNTCKVSKDLHKKRKIVTCDWTSSFSPQTGNDSLSKDMWELPRLIRRRISGLIIEIFECGGVGDPVQERQVRCLIQASSRAVIWEVIYYPSRAETFRQLHRRSRWRFHSRWVKAVARLAQTLKNSNTTISKRGIPV